MDGDGLSPATEAIERVIRAIPRGRVMTYGEIAKAAGFANGARQVARILHSRSGPGKLPWWRVLGKGPGKAMAHISLPAPGLEEQRALLLSEGIAVSEKGDVDLAQFGSPAGRITPRR